MPDLRQAFEQAARDVQLLAVRPDNETLLRLYALYKQASVGDLASPKPGFFDIVGSAKHQAWDRLRGLSRDDAMRQYVALVEQLRD